MKDYLNHYQIDTSRNPISDNHFYDPRPIRQDLDDLAIICADYDSADQPEWMQVLYELANASS